jgi:hypothetical protein
MYWRWVSGEHLIKHVKATGRFLLIQCRLLSQIERDEEWWLHHSVFCIPVNHFPTQRIPNYLSLIEVFILRCRSSTYRTRNGKQVLAFNVKRDVRRATAFAIKQFHVAPTMYVLNYIKDVRNLSTQMSGGGFTCRFATSLWPRRNNLWRPMLWHLQRRNSLACKLMCSRLTQHSQGGRIQG